MAPSPASPSRRTRDASESGCSSKENVRPDISPTPFPRPICVWTSIRREVAASAGPMDQVPVSRSSPSSPVLSTKPRVIVPFAIVRPSRSIAR
jgi:hypothetical protein